MNSMFSCEIKNNLAVVSFDCKGAPMNTWSSAGMESFMGVMADVEKAINANEVKGVIIISGKPNTFLAGADLNALVSASESEEICRRDIENFQTCFNTLADLPVPTLAAVNGHCLGGGFEFILACDARIAQHSKTTTFGLPEIGVGVFPAGGGTSRLTRLIGYPAIDLVLASKNLNAPKALELGAVDMCIEDEEDLLAKAEEFIGGIIDGTVTLNRPDHDFSDIDNVIAEKKKEVIKRAKGRVLPAPNAFLEVVNKGIKLPLAQSLDLEREYYVNVATSNETKGCINTFFLTSYNSNAKKFITKGYNPKPIKKAAVLGFGTMGRGIVIDIINKARIPVVVKDVPAALEAGQAFIAKIIGRMEEKGRLRGTTTEDLMKLIIPVTEYTDDFSDVDIVIEAVFEDVKVKENVYRELCEVVSKDCIIASNTSYLSVNELAQKVTNPKRFIGMHFFSPVWLMKLIEIVKSDVASQETIDNALSFVAMLRKRPVICNDAPGFVVNAVLDPFMQCCLKYLEEGNDAKKIDAAMVKFGFPVGGIRLLDEVGIDVSYHIFKSRGIEQKTIENMYNAGRFGFKKNGKGFYNKEGVDPAIDDLIAKKTPVDRTEEEMTEEILKRMITIGKRILDDGITADVRMIDSGMIFGTGYPVDKGGPMKWADIIGLSKEMFGAKFYN